MNKDGKKDVPAQRVEALAAQGLTIDEIAGCLSISRSTLYNRMGAEVDVLDAVKRGRSKGMATITNALFQSAKGGNTTAQIFYLKNRGPEEWRDRRHHELSGPDGAPIDLSWTVEVVEPKVDDSA